jgi:hypothetical protein
MCRSIAMTALLLLTASWPALAAPVKVLVADFDYQDSSGEVRNQDAAHDAQLKALKTAIIDAVNKDGRDSAAPLPCNQVKCSADDLDADMIAKAAGAAGAKFVVFGGVHKVSTLIQWGEIEVTDVATGKAVLARTVTFRGDDDAAWQHAAGYIGQMVVTAIQK